MATSKLILLGKALFRTPRPVSPFLYSSPVKPSIPFRQFFNFHRLCSFFAVEALTDESTEPVVVPDKRQLHPWPEWVAFVDRLKSQGYLSSAKEVEEAADDAAVNASVADGVYKDINVLKDVCLSFGRDRYDIFKSLSVEDMEAVVEGGCPNLLRKVVNSAKRLRAQLQMDEGDVCGACNLRGSCDRAYVIVQDSEAAARTVDIVRILLFYALDPLVISGGEKPPGRDAVESSARRLLSELNKFSEAPVDPALPQPAVRASPRSSPEKLRNDKFAKDVEMKKGDWMCPKCSFMNFSRNRSCFKCKTEGPSTVQPSKIEMKKGDWNCPQCEFMNFASNRKCLRCHEARPKRNLNPGEWECPSCDFLNYRRNMVCLKCSRERPKEEPCSEYEDHVWRHPRV